MQTTKRWLMSNRLTARRNRPQRRHRIPTSRRRGRRRFPRRGHHHRLRNRHMRRVARAHDVHKRALRVRP